jgi:uncharacterized pyridoxamine 5'-phosphate oxidase family protein
MQRLADGIIHFFQEQGFAIVSTIDGNGGPHNSCKGIVKINQNGLIYLFDLYKGKTYKNLKINPRMSISAVDEHKFIGYCLKGRAKIVKTDKLKPHILSAWDKKITSRISRRVIKNIQGEKGHPRHPEALLPKPEYMVVMKVKEVVNLTPHHVK